MSIASRITSIEEHLTESYQELQGIGIDTTGVNNNLENIPKLLDGYWETLPKVTDEGTLITLDNTKEGKMKVLLKGNTYQETTTQSANLFDEDYYNNDSLYSINTYKYTKLKRIKERGTLYFKAQLKTGKSEIGSFYLSLCSKVNPNTRPNNAAWAIYGTIVQDGSQYQNNYATFDEIDDLYFTFYPTTVAVNTIFDTYDFLISTDNISYVPFVPDSPNPDYPQDIHTVSGDNTIVSTGKNIAKATFDSGFYISGSGDNRKVASRVSDKCGEVIQVIPNTSYAISGTFTDFADSVLRISLFDTMPKVDDKPTANYNTGSTTTFTTGANTHYVLLYDLRARSVVVNDLQLEVGTSSTTYEPYVSSSYQVNLPIENLFNINGNINTQYNGNAITSNSVVDGNLVTTTNGGSFHPGGQKIYVGAGNTVTASMIFKDIAYSTQPSSDTIVAYIGFYNDNTITGRNLMNLRQNSIGTKITITFTPTTDYIYLVFARSSVVTSATFGEIQLEVGDKANTYTPYGTTPIELCKIGTYQDRFIRTRGKNLVDILNGTIVKRESATYTNINRTANTLSYNITTTVAGYLGFVIPIEIGKQYTLSFDRTSGYIYTIELDNMITEVGTNYGSPRTSGYSFTATKPYIGIWAIANTDGGSYASISNLILNEGTTALPYEPYGTNEWYLHKEIGKVVLDGSESWLKLQISSTGKYYFKIEPSYNQQTTNGKLLYSDYFLPNNTWSEQAIGMWFDRNLIVKTQGSLNNTETANDFKTWLGTHNTILYYVLATPTYTKIEGTLASQLEALNGSKSYTPQTNISQENNDMASVLNATALSDGTVTPSLQGVQTLSLGQNVDLQTQEPIEEQTEEVEEQGEEL